jgi:hypothetical protein
MTKRQRMWLTLTLTPSRVAAVLALLTGTGSAFAQTAEVVTDSVNVPVQVRTAMRGIPVVNTQQILHKSSLDPEEQSTSGDASSVRLLNNLDLNTVGLRMDLTATSWARTPGATSTPTPTSSTSSTSARSSTSTSSSTSSKSSTTPTSSSAAGTNGAKLTLASSNALAHAALEGTSEAVVRLGPANTEVVSVSGRGLASAAEITGTCGSLESASQVSLGTMNLRVLGREVALPENPAPNTEVALSDIPGLVSGTVVLNEQATFGDGVTTKIVAVAPLRLLLRLSLAGLGGLADIEVSLAGNSASVDCAPDDEAEPPAQTPGETPTTPATPTTPTTPTTPSTPSTPTTPTTPSTTPQPSSASTPPAASV